MHDTETALVAELTDLRRENAELRAELRRADADYCEMRQAYHALVERTPSRVLANADAREEEARAHAADEADRWTA